MDRNPSSGGQGNWPPPQSGSSQDQNTPSYPPATIVYTAPSSDNYVVSQSNIAASSITSAPHPQIVAPDNVNPFQLAPHGVFQPVYQAATGGAESSFARMSPVAVSDFQAVESSDGDALHQLQQSLQQGHAIIQVPIMQLDNLNNQTPTSSLAHIQPVDITVTMQSPGLPVSLASTGLPGSTLRVGQPSSSGVAPSRLQHSRGQQVSHQMPQTSREHKKPDNRQHLTPAPLYQVVSSMESTDHGNSEATPLNQPSADHSVGSVTLDAQQPVPGPSRVQVIAETFVNEPDTTQDEDSPAFQAVQQHESNEAFHSEATPLSLNHEASGVATVDSTGLDSSFTDGVGMVTSDMDSAMDSTVDDSMLKEQNDEEEEDDSESDQVDTSGQAGGEADLQEMLALRGGLEQVNDPSLPPVAAAVAAAAASVAGSSSTSGLEAGASPQIPGPIFVMRESSAPLQVRKSERLAQQTEQEPSPSRPKYVPKPYNIQEIWCEECQTTFANECPKHRSVYIYDKVVLSRAWATLPPQLAIFRLGESTDLGVFAKKAIPKRTHFGPFVAELVSSPEQLTNKKFMLKVERDIGAFYLEAGDENTCNWMMFVRPATSYAEQNMVAFQYGNDIFFATMKNIEPRQELKVWYAAHYAERLGMQLHEMSREDLAALDAEELRWPCFECPRKFKTSSQLQKHLLVHEESNFTSSTAAEREFNKKPKRVVPSTATAQSKSSIRRARAKPKKIREMMGEEGAGFQSWKKRTSYLTHINKMKKYREPIKRSIKTLYKKTREAGVNEWVCTHCSLTFDNPSLLNLHTLTHAAENVGLMDQLEENAATVQNGENSEAAPDVSTIAASLDSIKLVCPVCNKTFDKKAELIQHASEHGRVRRRASVNPKKPHKCSKCWKSFSLEEKLQRHLASHDESRKPLQCEVCQKRFMNNSALACHMKTHSENKYYDCPICRLGFERVKELKAHMETHRENNMFNCQACHKSFSDYNGIRKHIRAFHSDKQVACPECGREFPRPDKLKMHMLSHTNHREFMCEACGRQFKRKDKLKEHTKRMHNPERETMQKYVENRKRETSMKKFVPKVSPNDYHRFIYKCHNCLLGFKRRGMLVNHLAKRHPEVTPDTVPELNLPILKTQRDYYCQYCEKVYKSSSKRKSHILRNHPGAEVPPSARKQPEFDVPGLPNSTFSTPVGSVTTVPHSCTFCHKQYASKAKLMQHQRKKHTERVAPAAKIRRVQNVVTLPALDIMDSTPKVVATILQPALADRSQHQQQQQQELADLAPMAAVLGQTGTMVTVQGDAIQGADLLTQAMSELTQSLGEFRPQAEFQVTAGGKVLQTTNAILQPANINQQHTTIELSALGQTFAQAAQFQTQPQGQISVSGGNAVLSTVQPLTLAVNSEGQAQGQGTTVPITIAPAFIPRTWTATSVANIATFRQIQ